MIGTVIGLLILVAIVVAVWRGSRWVRKPLTRTRRDRKDGVEYEANIVANKPGTTWKYKLVVWREWLSEFDEGGSYYKRKPSVHEGKKVRVLEKGVDFWPRWNVRVMVIADRWRRKRWNKRKARSGSYRV